MANATKTTYLSDWSKEQQIRDMANITEIIDRKMMIMAKDKNVQDFIGGKSIFPPVT